MFKCSMCRTQWIEAPALKNNAGSFCGPCKEDIRVLIAEGKLRAKNLKPESSDESCCWCGGPAPDCSRDCRSKRAWLLRAIRLSPHPAQYVKRVEARERDERTSRIAIEGIRKADALRAGSSPAQYIQPELPLVPPNTLPGLINSTFHPSNLTINPDTGAIMLSSASDDTAARLDRIETMLVRLLPSAE